MVADNKPRRRRASIPPGFSPVDDDTLASGAATAAAYARHIEQSGLAETTVTSYTGKTAAFGAWLDESPFHRAGDVFTDHLARDHAVRDYKTHLLGGRGQAAASVDAALAALDGMFAWLGLGLAGVQRVGSRGSGNYGQHLSREQQRAVWRAAERRGPRDHALMVFLLGQGLRISEVHGLDVEDYTPKAREHDPRGQRIQVIGKGTKARDVFLSVRQREVLNAWYEDRRRWKGAADPAMFLALTGGRLSVRSIRHMVYEVARAAGVDDVHPHTLRHTLAHNMLEAGSLITEVQQQLGHASLATTQLYTQPTPAERAAAIERAEVDW